MKYVLILLFALESLTSHAQQCVWANNSSGTITDAQVAWDLKRHASGNLLICGTWGLEGPAPYSMIIGTDTFISSTQYNFFLAQYDTGGRVVWAKSFHTDGPLNNIFGCRCISDQQGNIYFVGTFSAKRLFLGPVTITNSDTVSSATDAFVAKFTNAGNLLWAVPFTGTLKGSEYVMDVVVDAADNIYVNGLTSSDTLKVNGNSYSLLTKNVIENIFVAKMSQDGAVKWLQHPRLLTSQIPNPIGTDISCLSYNNIDGIILTGTHAETPVVFGNDTLKTSLAGNDVAFVVKYDTLGNVKWVKDIGSNDIYSRALACDNFGNTYVAGIFTNASTTIDGHRFINAAIDSIYAMCDVFVVKYDEKGQVIWARAYGTRGDDLVNAITTDRSGHVFIGGKFAWLNFLYYGSSGIIHFGGMSFTSFNKSDDLFVVSLNAYTGQELNGFQLFSGGEGVRLLADDIGSLYIASDQWNINSLKIGSYFLASSSVENIFVAKFKTELPIEVHNISSPVGSSLRVYPNPTSGRLVIALDGSENNSSQIIVYTLTGQVVSVVTLSQFNSNIDLSGLPKGVYVYRIVGGSNQLEMGRIILK